ncbi:hypothetical protein CEE44_04165 [Candidatus Woesearchaeota archaeon B3_Woes]|nr:MAG: hypothetical protein CEE44_04165 [Candidatus Woesearchaeota archaeon B3_Woes]
MEEMMQLQQTEISQISSQLSNFLWSIFVGIAIVALVTFIAMCIFKGLIWFRIANKKFNFNYSKKFILLNLLWFLIWITPAILLFFVLKKEIIAYLLVIITILLLHFTNLLYISFTKNPKLSSIKKAFKIGIKKIHLFILPYLIAIIIFLVISQLYWLYNFMPGNTSTIITVLILIIYLAWFRIYLYNVVKDIKI